jgi:glucose/arabinose dehydrogenase
MKKTLWGIVIGTALVGGTGCVVQDKIMSAFFSPTPSAVEPGQENEAAKPPEVILDQLNIPWEIAFLPGGDLLVTERPGTLLRIGADKRTIPISGVTHRGEGGLLGLALHPAFAQNNLIYLYLTTTTEGGLTNRVERYMLQGVVLSDRQVIIEGIPGAANHDGGRIAFGPDGKLYITTGDAGKTANAQDTKSFAGKILRLNDDGSIPTDNPFGNAVYSYGHRNVQGIAWDEQGQLWATEHGRSGASSGYDELNKITPGANYGWPDLEGDETRAEMVSPQIHSGASDTWAPGGIAYLNGKVIFAGLRGEALYVADVADGTAKNLKTYLRETYGRLRTVTVGPDGMLYVLTSNRDGRGKAEATDDRIIKVDPKFLGL